MVEHENASALIVGGFYVREFERRILDIAVTATETDLSDLCDRLEALGPEPVGMTSSPVLRATLTPGPSPRPQGGRAGAPGRGQA